MDALIIWGVVTWYSLEAHAGQPLRCGGEYDTTRSWIAVDIDALGWQCGDVVVVWANGQQRRFVVRDSGPLSQYCVMDGMQYLPIVADVPEHVKWFGGLSTQAVVVNTSRAKQALERMVER